MPDDRIHDHYVFQDLDLLGNDIKEVNDISAASSDDLILTAGTNKKVKINSDSDIKGNVSITDNKTLTVSGTSEFKDNVTIDPGKNLTISGVRIEWDAITQSLVFIKTNSAPSIPSN